MALSLPLPRSSDVNSNLFILEVCTNVKDQVSVMLYFRGSQVNVKGAARSPSLDETTELRRNCFFFLLQISIMKYFVYKNFLYDFF